METAGFTEDNPYADLPTRPMRVKVLYSFDSDNKTNCLARFPNTLQIPAVAIDETSQVGVIELRQCIQAVLSASPEMITKLSDGDFAIYAFDYSEFETPLVGQGMLSAVMASSIPGPNEEKTMITGRVCKNVPAIFSNGVKETLEVKLRMVPVAKVAQASTLPATDKLQLGSSAMSGGFDPNAWNMSLHQHKPHQSMHDYFDIAVDSSNQSQEMMLGNDIFGLGTAISGSEQVLDDVGATQTPTEPDFGLNPAFATTSLSASGSRTGSPINVLESNTSNEHLRHQSFSGYPSTFVDHSRPASRTSIRSEVSSSRKHQRHGSSHSLPPQQTQEQTEIYYNEDGLPRKRAKVVQTDWHGRSSFGSRSADLRITAAAANSVHMHRPIPKRATAPGSDLEPPPRVPTPVPQRHFLRHQRSQISGPSRSMLRQASTADSDFMSDFDQYSDALVSSPEEESPTRSTTAGGTPQDIPSSPPVFPGMNQPQPSSPGLPSLPPARMTDSGYMSEQAWLSSNIMDSLEGNGDCGQYAQDHETSAQTILQRGTARSHSFIKTEERASNSPPVMPSDVIPSDIEFQMVMPGDESQLPRKMLLDLPPQRDTSLGPKGSRRTAGSRPPLQAHNTAPAAPKAPFTGPATKISDDTNAERAARADQATSRRSSLALPPNLPSSTTAPTISARAPSARAESQKPEQRRRKPLKRTRTQAESEAGSPAPSDNEGRPRGLKRSGSGATRRMVIQDRLEQSLLSGEAPQFCAHCGAIETPTWRRLYIKHIDGKPSPLDEAEGEGEIIGVEATEKDEASGEVLRFVIRKSLKRDKNSRLPKPGDGFEDTTLCNPCGLWFNKTRTMRPADRWGKKPSSRKSRKSKAGDGAGLMTDSLEPQSEAFFTDAVEPDEPSDDIAADEFSSSNTDEERRKPTANRQRRATSLQPEQQRRTAGKDKWNASRLDAALSRQVQSSPVRFGSQASPIEIDELTPKPTRRLLFPSPRKDGEVKSLDDNGQASLNATLSASKTGQPKSVSSSKLAFTSLNNDVSIFEAFTSDKENVGPALDDFGGLADLFEGSPASLFKTPRKTPTKNRSPLSQDHLNSLLKTPSSATRKRKPLSVDKNVVNGASASRVSASAAAMHDFMTSPSSSRYFLRSTPSRAGRTPGRTPGRANAGAHDQVSPFSRQLAEMLSDTNAPLAGFTSPSRGSGAFDFSDLPTFSTPGRQMDWSGIDDMLQSSEFATFDEDCAGVGSNGSG